MSKHTILVAAVAGMVLAMAPAAQAYLSCQLGLLDLTKDYGSGAGVNPATGNPWALGDAYHLIYVTNTTRDATSTNIADYNAFVQADADAEGIGATVGATWSVVGSTATVNAKDNAVITGPVFGIYSDTYIAKDAADFWDFIFPSSNLILTLAGEPKNAHTGTTAGGVALRPFGGTSVEFDWTAWQNWRDATKWGAATIEREFVAMSSPLETVNVIYWDLNGATEGAGGATPAGTWNAANTYWNPVAEGTGSTEAWSAGGTAHFAAGTDASGTYTVTVDGTQDIGGMSFEEGTVTLTPGTDGALRMTSGTTVDVAAGLTATVQPPISEDATARSLLKKGDGTLVLSGANTYTGTTTVNEGTLVLSGSPTGQSNTTVNGSTLKLDYSTDDTSKIHDSAVLTLGGATVELAGGSHTEVVASATIAAGLSSVTRSSGSATIRLNNLSPATGGMVNFAAPSIATTDNTNTNGILGPWATVGNADWAQNSTDAADGPITAYTAYTAYTDIAATGDTITDGSTTNVRLNSAGSGGNLALSAATTAVNTLLQNTATAATVDTAAKTLRTGGIMIGTGQEAVTIGAAAGDGTLTVASAGGDLILNNTNAAKTLTVNAVIANNTSASTLTMAGNVLLQGVNTYTGATYVNAGTLEIGGAGQLAGGTYSAAIAIARGATLKYNSSANQTLSGVIRGSGGLLKDAAGTLILSGANTYTGTTTISGGTLQIGSGGGAGSLSTSSTITNNAALVFNRNNVITQGLDFAYGISGSGDVTQAGTGTLILSGTNTYTGGTTVSSGTLTAGSAASLPGYDDSAKVSVAGSATLAARVGGAGWSSAQLNTLKDLGSASWAANSILGMDTIADFVYASAIGDAGANARGLIKLGANALTLDQANTYTGPTTVSAGTLVLSGSNSTSGVTLGAATLVINHAQALGAGTFTIAGAGTVQAEGSIVTTNAVAANSNFTIAGAGQLTLGNMTLSANRTITNNNTTATTTLGAISGTNRTLTFAGNGDTAVTGIIATGTGTLTKQGTGTLTLANANTYTGATTVQAGTLLAGTNAPSGADGAFGKATSDVVLGVAGGNDAAGILIGGPYTVARIIRNATSNATDAGTRVLTLGGSTADNSTFSGNIFLGTTNQTSKGVTLTAASGGQVTFSGVIQNPTGQDAPEAAAAAALVAVTKAGLGTVLLTGANTYTGATTVNVGKLLINGNQSAATGAVTVASGATLGGSGTIGGTVIVNGTLAPGGSIGTLKVGATTINGTFLVEVNNVGGSDLLEVTGDLTLGSGSILSIVDPNQLAAGIDYVIATYTGSLSGTGEFTGGNNMPGGWYVDYGYKTANTITLVPEPATLALLGLGGLGLILGRKRR